MDEKGKKLLIEEYFINHFEASKQEIGDDIILNEEEIKELT